jgi:hypothetical protein
VDVIANAIRPTLEAAARLVLLEKLRADRRLNSWMMRHYRQANYPDQTARADVGAMLIRNASWKMHLEVGDGSATMAVMYQVLFSEGAPSPNSAATPCCCAAA